MRRSPRPARAESEALRWSGFDSCEILTLQPGCNASKHGKDQSWALILSQVYPVTRASDYEQAFPEIQWILYWQIRAKTVTFTAVWLGEIRDRVRGTMVAHCVNPSCGARLHSFAEGRLFQFEVVSISVSATDDLGAPFDEEPRSQTAQFWLCGRCAASMTLKLEPTNGLKVVPLTPGSTETKRLAIDGGTLPEANHC